MQQIDAAGVAEGLDLVEQVQNWDAGFGGAASAQVIAVGVNQASAVLRGTAQLVGFGSTSVTLDGIEAQAEAAGAVQQTGSVIEQVVDGVPAFECCFLASQCLAFRSGLGPAAAVGGHCFLDCSRQPVP